MTIIRTYRCSNCNHSNQISIGEKTKTDVVVGNIAMFSMGVVFICICITAILGVVWLASLIF